MEEYEKMRRIKRDISDLDEDIQCVKMERGKISQKYSYFFFQIKNFT